MIFKLLLAIFFKYEPVYKKKTYFSTIYEETAADIAGLLTNDRILEINSEVIYKKKLYTIVLFRKSLAIAAKK